LTFSEGLKTFFELWEIFWEPTLAGTFAGAVLGLLGVHIVARRMVFLTAALSQTSSLGIVIWVMLAPAIGLTGGLASPLTGAILAALLTMLVVMSDRSAGGYRRDSLLGLAFLLGAGGTFVLLPKVQVELQDIQTLLFGNAVAILHESFVLILAVFGGILAIQLVGRRGFAAVTADKTGAAVRGLPTFWIELVLLATLAVAVSTCTRVLGALPAFAFSVLPAMAALRLAPNLGWAQVSAAVLGAFCGFGGYAFATALDWSVGGTQTLVGVAVVLSAEFFALLRAGWRRVRASSRSAV